MGGIQAAIINSALQSIQFLLAKLFVLLSFAGWNGILFVARGAKHIQRFFFQSHAGFKGVAQLGNIDSSVKNDLG